MEVSYTIIGQEVRIDKVEDPEPVVVIPETCEGYPVVEMGAYVLSGSLVEEIHLPSRLRKIGAYGFYGCRKLKKIFCYGRTLDLGAGLFADAGNVEFLDLTLFEGEQSCFREILSELRQTLRVRVHRIDETGRELEEMRLIFPEYYEESVENTPARILFIETHGCGHRYRYCFANREFQYSGYDELFPHVKVQESEELVTELALGRILFPGGLREQYRTMYMEYVKEHWVTVGKLLIDADEWRPDQVTNLDSGMIGWFASEILTSAEQIRTVTELAQQARNTEAVSRLMDISHQRFGREGEKKRRFEL